MFEFIVDVIVGGIIGTTFFYLGRFYLWCFSLGKIKVDNSTGSLPFFVSLFGFIMTIFLVFLALKLDIWLSR